MDFTLDDEQQAIADLATQILDAEVTEERLREVTAGEAPFDERTWTKLAEAGLVSIVVPEADGGSGYGILEACLVLEEVGRHVAAVPYLAAVVGGAMPLARFGTEAQRADLLPGVLAGTHLVVPALAEHGSYVVPSTPTTTLVDDGDGWRLDGEKLFVPWADRAHRLLVPARRPDGTVAVALVDPAAEGVELEAMATTSGLPESIVRLSQVAVTAADLLGGPDAAGDDVVRWLVDHLTVGVCATQAGVSEGALRLTATYTSERHQFGSPIATFQAVAHRAADAYIDTQGIRFTMWQAAWRLGEGLPAADEIDVAKVWAADGGHRVALAAQHLHGGIGVDVDYPLHRFFLWAKQLELTLGGATEHLRLLGARLAAGVG